jgi:hypothetical protein
LDSASNSATILPYTTPSRSSIYFLSSPRRCQHKQIHKGLDKLEKYLEECVDGERELRMSEMKEILDTFGTVLWQHLDDEVKQLGAENMRKYWTVEEIKRMPM